MPKRNLLEENLGFTWSATGVSEHVFSHSRSTRTHRLQIFVMPLSVRSIVLWGLPWASIAQARNLPDVSDVNEDRRTAWSQKLESVSGESLKAAIQSHVQPQYKEGVCEDGHEAIAAVHSEDAILASKLVDLARQDAIVKDDLRKRQDNNATVSAVSTSTSSVVVTDIVTTTALTTESLSTDATSQLSTSQGQSFTSSSAGSSGVPPSTSVETSVVIETVSSTIITVGASSSTTEVQTTPAATTSRHSESTFLSSQEQSSSSTVVPVTTEPSTSEQPRETTTQPPTTQTGILVPIVTSTTVGDGSVRVSTTSAFETTAQTSIIVDQTSTNDNGETIVTSAMVPATIVTQTNSQGSTMVTTMPVSIVSVVSGGSIIQPSGGMLTTTDQEGGTVVLSRPISGGTYTMTDSSGRVATVTYQPGGGTVSQVRVRTTTLANGHRSTITYFAEVGSETRSAAQSTGASDSGDQPGLQSGAGLASSYFAAGAAMVAGAIIGAALLV